MSGIKRKKVADLSKASLVKFVSEDVNQKLLTEEMRESQKGSDGFHCAAIAGYSLAYMDRGLEYKTLAGKRFYLENRTNKCDAVFMIEGFVEGLKLCPAEDKFRAFDKPGCLDQEVRIYGGGNDCFETAINGVKNIIAYINLKSAETDIISTHDSIDKTSMVATTPLVTEVERQIFSAEAEQVPETLPAVNALKMLIQKGVFVYTQDNHVVVKRRVCDTETKSIKYEAVSQAMLRRGMLVQLRFSVRGGYRRDLYYMSKGDNGVGVRFLLTEVRILDGSAADKFYEFGTSVFERDLAKSRPKRQRTE